MMLERAIISLKGEDTKGFLQGLITQDIENVIKQPCYSLMLDHKGFIAFDFFIFNKDNIFYIDINKNQALSFVAKLKLYKLRSKVDINILEDFNVYACLANKEDLDTKNENLIAFKDPRHNKLGLRVVSKSKTCPAESLQEYNTLRYALAIAEGEEIEQGKAVALEWGFEELNAICFNKGCYLGQELITASKRKLVIRKRLLAFKFNGIAEKGDKITNQNNEKVGSIKYISQGYALAMVKMKHKEEELYLNKTKIQLIIPSHITNYSDS